VSESLPFTVRPVRDARELSAVRELRVRAYERHYPAEYIEVVRSETEDDVGAEILQAIDKESRRLLGTLRVRTSVANGVSLDMPMLWHELGTASFSYIDRFAAEPGPLADVVMLALTKAQWFFAYQQGVQWITGICVAGLVRRYRQVGLRLMRGQDGTDQFTRDYAPGVIWHGVGETLTDMPLNLLRTRPSLATFMFDVDHPDLPYARPMLLDEHIAAARRRHDAARATVTPQPATQPEFA
jgi:hypothetical protein